MISFISSESLLADLIQSIILTMQNLTNICSYFFLQQKVLERDSFLYLDYYLHICIIENKKFSYNIYGI